MEELKPSPANATPLTLLGFLERVAVVYGDCTSLVYDDTTYTWSNTHLRCLRLASSIASIVDQGQVVSVVAPNIPAMFELHFAAPMAGAILNTIDIRLDARTISILLRHAESKLVFVDYQSTYLVFEALSLFPQNSYRPTLVLIAEPDCCSLNLPDPFHDNYECLVESGDPEFNWIRPRSEWDPMVLNYTSGTTSLPKGVVHCHRGLFLVSLDSLVEWSVPKQAVFLWTLPMFHSNGWSFPWGLAALGAKNVCLRKFDAGTVYATIHRHGVTHMCGASVILNVMTNSADEKPLENPVHFMTAAASPPPAVLLRAESLGFVVSHGYGLTETGGIVVSCAWKQKWNRLPATERARLKARQGVRSMSMTEVDVIDPMTRLRVKQDGTTLGEIVLRGCNIMLGYLKDRKGTAKCMTEDGWFFTGDVAVMHFDGYLEIKDRSKDVIITGGENVSTVEVESILYNHTAVNEAAVVARLDDFWGETLCAFVSLKAEATVTENDVIEFCRSKMPHYMVPKTVVFIDE